MYVISPSVSLQLTPSSSEEGKEYEPRFWLHLMGELSAQGGKPCWFAGLSLDRLPTVESCGFDRGTAAD